MNILAPKKGEYALLKEQAADFLASGFLPKSFTKPEQVVLMMQMARELGIPPVQAINGIHVIEGRPTVSPQLMLALIERSGQLKKMRIESHKEYCKVEMIRKGRDPHTEIFTLQDAQRMCLTNKFNWKRQPTTMLKWRAVSACARVVFSDIIMGLYTTEEIEPDIQIVEENPPINRLENPPENSVLEGEIIAEKEAKKEDKILSIPSPQIEQEEAPSTESISEKINGNTEPEKKDKGSLVKRYLERAVEHLEKGKEWLEESMKSRGISYDSMTEPEYKEFKQMSSELTQKGLEADLEMLKSSLEKKGVPKEETKKLGEILSNPATPETEMERVKKKLKNVDDSQMVSDSDIAILVTYAEFLEQKEVAEEADNILRDGIGYAKLEFMEIVEKLEIVQSGKSN